MIMSHNIAIQSRKDNSRMARTLDLERLGKAERILAVLFAFGAILGFLLTPLGLSPRSNELRTLAFAGFFIVVGLVIPIAGPTSVSKTSVSGRIGDH